MKLRFIIMVCLFMGFHDLLFAQQDARKALEEAKKQIADVADIDPETKKQIMDMLNSSDVEETLGQPGVLIEHTAELTSLPAPDRKRLAGIPSGTFTEDQLRSFVQNITSKITAQLDAGDGKRVQALIKKANGNSLYLSTEAVVAWYNGSPQEALCLVSHAATLPGNSNALTNLGAMLNICGYEEKAIPVLQYALKADSKNSTVLNNLGRAYLGLGEKKKAEEYYLACIALAPTHPEANNALGCLYQDAGDPKKATEYFEKSLDGGYNEEAARQLDKASPAYTLIFHIGGHHKPPETFNQFKFQIPEECHSREDYHKAEAKHAAFQKSIRDLKSRYGAIADAIGQKSKEEIAGMQKKIMDGIAKREIPVFNVSPFAVLSVKMILNLTAYYTDVLSTFERTYQKDLEELHKKYVNALEESRKEIEKGNIWGTRGEFTGCLNCEDLEERLCAARGRVADAYQMDAASLHRHYVDKYRLALTGYFDEAAYWNYLGGAPQTTKDAAFYQLIADFLDHIEGLSRSTPLWASPGTCDSSHPYDEAEKKYAADIKPQCPINISFPFIVGKLTLDCSAFSISGGEGFTAGYKKNFITGQTTLSIGAGITFEAGAMGAGVSAGASESIYVTFDKGGNPTDAGLKFDAGGKIKTGNISTGSGLGYTLGINSGWNFTANAAGQTVKL